MNPVLESELFADADRAFAEGQRAYIAFGQALSALNDKGVTQQEIGKRYQLSQGAIAAAIAVGTDKRIIASSNNLPKSTKSLYLLTTLNDEDFEKLAKPETTQADIIKVKSPEQPQRGPSEAMQNRLHMQSLYREIDKLKAEVTKWMDLSNLWENTCQSYEAENAKLKAENAKLKAEKPEPNAVKVKPEPEPKTKSVKPKADKPVKVIKAKDEKPVVDNADRNATLLELYALYKAMIASQGRDAELKPFDTWIKTSFLGHLRPSITSRTGFEFLSVDKKLSCLTDAEFAEHVADVKGVYES